MKVCFFSPTAYSYFRPDKTAWAGGAETQQLLLANHMKANGIDVSFIVGDFGQGEEERVDGITLIRSFTPFKGNRKLRFIPDMIKIRNAMKRADADIYNQRSTAFFTGQLAHFARELGRAFTFSLGAEYNCYPDGLGAIRWPMPLLYRYGIRAASAVISQTEKQQRLMRENFERETVLIRNGIEIPPAGGAPAPGKRPGPLPNAEGGASDRGYLWVGRFQAIKRPDLLLECARALPRERFTVIGGYAGDERYARETTETLRGLPNVEHIPFVAPRDMDEHYRAARALLNTSDLEGFPNTYLHAWAHGVPVITIGIDPDGIIAKNGIGIVTGTFENFLSTLRTFRPDREARARIAANSLAYVRANHDIRDRGDDYIRLFESILRSSR
jgi:glycosyltransferase involved in cell wall biosynthesis